MVISLSRIERNTIINQLKTSHVSNCNADLSFNRSKDFVSTLDFDNITCI